MKRRAVLLVVTLAVLGTIYACTGGQKIASGGSSKLSDIVYPPIKTDIPKPVRLTLSNGMRVLLIADHELPLFAVSAMIKVGAIWEPADKVGLASMTGAAVRAGGTTSHPPDELDEMLERIAGSVEVGIGAESGSASLSVLAKDREQGLKLFADVLRNPRFDRGRFELMRARISDGIRRENDDPTRTGLRELKKILYKGSPYGRTPTIETINSITTDDARKFHSRYFVPNNIILGVTGDFDETTIVEELENVFGSWGSADPEFSEVAKAKKAYGFKIYLAEKNLPQAVIRVGHLVDINRRNPDYYAGRVMDKILGGNGFASRLVKKIRTERGLAYSAWSYLIAGRLAMGRFMMGAETKTASAHEVISIMLDETNKIIAEKVGPEELLVAKNSIANSFVFIFDKPSRIMGEWLTVAYYGLADNYLIDYRDKILAVTSDDVSRVAKKYLKPQNLTVVVVGEADKLEKQLLTIGPVIPLKLTDYGAADRGKGIR